MSAWKAITLDNLPPENVVIETKVQDATGDRNQCLMRWERTERGRMWFFANALQTGVDYPYWNPTHWRHAQHEAFKPTQPEIDYVI